MSFKSLVTGKMIYIVHVLSVSVYEIIYCAAYAKSSLHLVINNIHLGPHVHVKALTHYKDFHKDFSKKIVGKIVVHI